MATLAETLKLDLLSQVSTSKESDAVAQKPDFEV